MSRESHHEFLEQSAARTVRRALARDAQKLLQREDAAKLRIQTVEPWKRILCLLIGGFLLAASWGLCLDDGNIWAVMLIGALGLAAAFVGMFGRKKSIDDVLEASGDALISGLFD